jgi:transketolase
MTTAARIKELEVIAQQIRIECLKSIYHAGSGHPGGSFSAAEIMAALYFEKMRLKPEEPLWADRDRFILSKGHVAPVLYATLALRGYFSLEELKTLRQLDSRLQGHPTYLKTPGVDMTSGSLGQGLSIGLGMRLAARLSGQDFKVFVLLGDGELQEGQVWEAAMAAVQFKVDRLIAIVDRNRVQLDGNVGEIMEVEPLADKWRAFGWPVISADGHNMAELMDAFEEADSKSATGPSVIIADTVKGKGVSFMENQAYWHGNSPNPEQYSQAMDELQQKLGGDLK